MQGIREKNLKKQCKFGPFCQIADKSDSNVLRQDPEIEELSI